MIYKILCHMSCVTCHVLSVTCQMYHVMCQKHFSLTFLLNNLNNIMRLVGAQSFAQCMTEPYSSEQILECSLVQHSRTVSLQQCNISKMSILLKNKQWLTTIIKCQYNDLLISTVSLFVLVCHEFGIEIYVLFFSIFFFYLIVVLPFDFF